MNYLTLREQISKREIAPLYLFYGSENFLLEDLLKNLRQQLLGEEIFNYQVLEEEKNSLPELAEAVSTWPMLGEKKIVVFRSAKLLSGEEELLKIIEDLPDFTHLVIFTFEVDKRKKIYQTCARKGQVAQLAPLRPWELEKWILDAAGQKGKRLDREAMAYLLEIVGKDLPMLLNELEKAALYVGEKELISKKDLEEIVHRQGEQNIFHFIDALGNRKTEKALILLQQLLAQGEPPGRILYLIIQQFRLLWQVKFLAEQGVDPVGIGAKLRQRSLYAVEKSLARGKNFTWRQLEELMSILLAADQKIKSSPSSPRLILEMLTIALG